MRSEKIGLYLMRMVTNKDPREVIKDLKRTRIGKAGVYVKQMVTNKALREVITDLKRGRIGKAGFHFNRMVTNKTLREVITDLKRKRIGKAELKTGASAFIDEQNTQAHIDRLSREGCTVLDHKLSQDKIDAIIRYSELIRCYDLYRSDTEPIDPKHAPAVTHVAEYKREDLVKYEPILEIVNDPGVLKVVQEFLGARPTISNINMWWSFGGREQAKHAQLFHRDVDDWKFCKLFFYLTDVTANSGPHVYVKNSSKSPAFRKPRRYSDSEIEGEFGKENILEFIDTRGAAFIVDTYGFHKGLLPKTGDRLLLQAQYSLDPIGLEEYHPIKLESAGHDPYINRLLYNS
jgi:hypothetical protein